MRAGGLLACSLGLLSSCSHAAPEAKNATLATPTNASVSGPASKAKTGAGPRLFPPTHGPGTQEAGVDHDGSRRLLAFGLRVVEHPDGSLDVGD